MEQYYKIAGLVVKMDSFGRTVRQAEAYRIAPCEKVDVHIQSKWQDRKKEYPLLSDEDCEYMSTGNNFYRHLIDHDGLQLHSSAVVVDGKAYLFTADPGTGKSTHAGYWLQLFGDRAYILNDDKPALRRENGVWYAYGTPWSGKHDISRNERAELAGIAVLERGKENAVVPFSGIAAIQAILQQVNRPIWAEYRVKLIQHVDKLMTEVPIWKLRCTMDPQAAVVAYETMSKKETEK